MQEKPQAGDTQEEGYDADQTFITLNSNEREEATEEPVMKVTNEISIIQHHSAKNPPKPQNA